jgi:hypothetical protein
MLCLLGIGAAVLQLALQQAFAAIAPVLPLLPVALIAAWGTMRGSSDIWLALPVAGSALGLASEQRVGWFLLALLPTAAFLLAPATIGGNAVCARRVARASTVGALGTAAYVVTLFLAARDGDGLRGEMLALAVASIGTAVVAACCALALWPLRARPRRLFE